MTVNQATGPAPSEPAAAAASPELVQQVCRHWTAIADRAAAGQPGAMEEMVMVWEEIATLPDQKTIVTMTRCLIAGMLLSLAMSRSEP